MNRWWCLCLRSLGVGQDSKTRLVECSTPSNKQDRLLLIEVASTRNALGISRLNSLLLQRRACFIVVSLDARFFVKLHSASCWWKTTAEEMVKYDCHFSKQESVLIHGYSIAYEYDRFRQRNVILGVSKEIFHLSFSDMKRNVEYGD